MTAIGSTENHCNRVRLRDFGLTMQETRLEKLRRMELGAVKDLFAPDMCVLEIGGGNGFQASLISSWGCKVESIDISSRPQWPVTYFKVRDYDGRHLPFPDGSFDLVFSSNVLEHVPIDILPRLLQETVRVMRKPKALALHILPTPAWRFWNNLAHYIYLLKYVLGYGKSAMMPAIPTREQALQQYGLAYLIKRALIPPPHGESPDAIRELFSFSQRRWRDEFAKVGLSTEQVLNLQIFYTGYGLTQNISPQRRVCLSRYLGTATSAYILRSSVN
jgi:SAM-dependent methyltransferase